MRKIDSVIIHCSATKAGMDFSVADISLPGVSEKMPFPNGF